MIGLRKFRLVSAEARGRGTRDEFLRASAWEARATSLRVQLVLVSQ